MFYNGYQGPINPKYLMIGIPLTLIYCGVMGMYAKQFPAWLNLLAIGIYTFSLIGLCFFVESKWPMPPEDQSNTSDKS